VKGTANGYAATRGDHSSFAISFSLFSRFRFG
jgi:hypothetical protein